MEGDKPIEMSYLHATFGSHNPFFREHWEMCLAHGIEMPEVMQMASEKSDYMRFERELLNLLK